MNKNTRRHNLSASPGTRLELPGRVSLAICPLGLIALASCATAPVAPEHAPTTRPAVGPLRLASSNQPATVEHVAATLASKRFVLLGEKHDNPTHHEGQAALVAALVHAGKRPAIVFEMITEAEGAALARYTAKPEATAENLGPAVRWEERGWPSWSIYQPIANVAFASGLRLIAGGISRTALRHHLAATTHPPKLPTAFESALAQSVRDAHCGYANTRAVSMMVRAQQLRDAFMARQLVEAARGSDGMAVLIAGNEHVRRDRGIPFYLERTHGAHPEQIGVVTFTETAGGVSAATRAPKTAALAPAFDFVWYTPQHDNRDPCERFRAQLERMKKK